MRLVIDIPEYRYKSIKNLGIKQNEVYMLEKAIANGTPIPTGYSIGLAGCFDKTLEEIRKEITDLPKTYPFINHIDTYVKTDDVIRIIDRHTERSE